MSLCSVTAQWLTDARSDLVVSEELSSHRCSQPFCKHVVFLQSTSREPTEILLLVSASYIKVLVLITCQRQLRPYHTWILFLNSSLSLSLSLSHTHTHTHYPPLPHYDIRTTYMNGHLVSQYSLNPLWYRSRNKKTNKYKGLADLNVLQPSKLLKSNHWRTPSYDLMEQKYVTPKHCESRIRLQRQSYTGTL